METNINKVILQGKVGAAKDGSIANTAVKRFSLVTNRVYKDRTASIVIESTWHTCVAFESEDITKEQLDAIKTEATVRVEGRLSNNRYIGPDGNERTFTEINVEKLSIIQPDKE